MKGKIIYVDFATGTKKVAYAEEQKNKGLLTIIKEKFKKAFSANEEPDKLKKEVYNFKRMM
jgi:hypothetical protein